MSRLRTCSWLLAASVAAACGGGEGRGGHREADALAGGKAGAGGAEDVKAGAGGAEDVKAGAGGAEDVKAGAGGADDVKAGAGGTDDVKAGAGGTGGGAGDSGGAVNAEAGAGGTEDASAGAGGADGEGGRSAPSTGGSAVEGEGGVESASGGGAGIGGTSELPVSSGGSDVGSGGYSSSSASGGVSTSQGGASASQGGASTSQGGASTSQGGASTSQGGASTSQGGASTSQGGATGGTSAAGTDLSACTNLARGVTLSRLSLSQAVEIPLMQDGQLLPAANRKAKVVQGRDALFRVFLNVDAGWTPRELGFRLRLRNGGNDTVLAAKRVISASSEAASLSSTVQFEVGASLVASDTLYSVETLDCGANGVGEVLRPRYPETGEQALDASASGRLRVKFVPINFGGSLPDTSEAALNVYRETVMAMYPTTEVITSLGAELGYNPTLGVWSVGGPSYLEDLLYLVTDRRMTDKPADDVYYYGLIKPAPSFNEACPAGVGCSAGLGYVANAGSWAAYTRVAVGLAFAERVTAETFAHELGHNHGSEHSPCGNAGYPDPYYPYAKGLIGSWGYDRRTQTLKDPATVADLMGYCEPVWISDYTYQNFFERIVNVSSLASGRVLGTAAPKQWWRAAWLRDGQLRWGPTPYRQMVAAGTPEAAVIFDAADNAIATTLVYSTRVSMENLRAVLVPQPMPGWHAISVGGSPPLRFVAD